MRTALVIGTGLIGTSAALALAGRGVTVHLTDHAPDRARTAVALGAGSDEPPPGRVDLALVAVPPAHTAPTGRANWRGSSRTPDARGSTSRMCGSTTRPAGRRA